MATRIWRGTAADIAQLETITVTAPVIAGETWTVTINSKSVTFAATAATVANVTAGLSAALVATSFPEFKELTWTSTGTTVIGTGKVAGVPHTITVSTNSATGLISRATTTSATGRNWWSNTANWTTSTVPIAADDVIVDSPVAILYGLAQSAVTLTSLTVSGRFAGNGIAIGLPVRNPLNSPGYDEYRDTYLAISVTTLTIGDSSGAGSGRIKINVGANACTGIVNRTGSPAEFGVEAFLFKGTHAANTLEINGDSSTTVGVAMLPGETATIATLRQSAGTCRCSSGVTLTTIITSGGTLETNSGCTTLTISAGQATLNAGAHTTINCVADGSVIYNSSSTITNLNISSKIDFSNDLTPRTVTTCNAYSGYDINDKNKTVTWTNGINLNQCGVTSRLSIGVNVKVTPVTL